MDKNFLVYNGIYAIENGYNSWGGGFLDTRGSGCQDNKLCVSTNKDTPWRDGRSGIWKIISANSKAAGEPVKANDTIHLQNLYINDGTFLDTRGGGCSNNLLCVSAATTPNRDNGSGTWIIIPAETIDGTIPEAAPVRFLNGFNQFSGGFLDTRGAGCDGNFLCVSTSATFNRDGMSTLWRLAQPLTEIV
jgi:ribosomal protein S27E